jgi:tetratricopeptide (TPR) repeat protein
MIERGQFAHGVAVLKDAFDDRHRTGWYSWYSEFKGALAVGLARLGQLDDALAAVNEGLDGPVKGEQPRYLFFGELLRIKGEIFLSQGSMTAAEDLFRKAIEIAREQEALLWELRATLGFGRLRATQGRGVE